MTVVTAVGGAVAAGMAGYADSMSAADMKSAERAAAGSISSTVAQLLITSTWTGGCRGGGRGRRP